MNKAGMIAVSLGLTLGGVWLWHQQSGSHSAAHWPTKPVRIVLPASTGGAIDLTARLLGERLAQVWNQSVVVDNRPGGEGLVGTAAFVEARDDHALLFTGSAVITLYPQTCTSLPFDAGCDLLPITSATEPTIVIAAATSFAATSLAELVRLVREHPGEFIWTGITGVPELVFSAIVRREKLEMKHAPYSEISMALQDFAQGRVHIMVAAMTAVDVHVRAGRAHLLAVGTSKRSVAAPQIPTLVEAGYPNLTMDGTFGFYGSRAMTEAVRRKIAADVQQVLAAPGLAARLTAMGQNPRASTPEEYAEMHERQSKQVAALLQAVGFKRE